jgi:hypothetical protein
VGFVIDKWVLQFSLAVHATNAPYSSVMTPEACNSPNYLVFYYNLSPLPLVIQPVASRFTDSAILPYLVKCKIKTLFSTKNHARKPYPVLNEAPHQEDASHA